jgi:hypothetical protein
VLAGIRDAAMDRACMQCSKRCEVQDVTRSTSENLKRGRVPVGTAI